METLPWASGRRKPVPGAKPRRRRRSRTSARSVLWAVATLLLTITFLIVQGTLLLIFLGLSAAITSLSVYADQKADPDDLPPPKPAAARAASSPGKAQRRPAASAQPRCTRTKQPIDICSCAEKHVASDRGSRRYKLAVGAPLQGKRAASKPKVTVVKEPKVPTTNNAKPTRQVAGERMRRVQ